MPPSPLTYLLENGAPLRAAYDGAEPVILRGAVETGRLPDGDAIHELISGSLLRRPYFALLLEGVKPPDDEVLATRRVGGTPVNGFIDPEGVRGHLARGATLKLNQVEDWHPLIRSINDELNAVFPVESKAYLFYTPAGKRGMLPHRDGSRVIAVQLEGAKEWHLYDSPTGTGADAGLDVDTSREQVVLMEPGDLLYLPHGYGHAATAVDRTSLHVTFTLTEPTPSALAQAYLAEWLTSGREVRATSTIEIAKALLADLADFGAEIDGAALLRRALTTARTRDASR